MQGAGMAKHRKSYFRRIAENRQMYLFLILPLIWLIIFKYGPMYGAQIAFKLYVPKEGIWGSKFVGLANFDQFFKSLYFSRTVGNTLILSAYSIAVGFPIPIIFALLLNVVRSRKWKGWVENVTYMPHFISTVVIVGMVIRFFNPTLGPISKLIQYFGGTNRDLMGVEKAVPHLYVWSGIWQNAGWATILYLATLSGVDPTLHEAAIVDGATRMQRVRHIDLPSLAPTIVITLIMDVGRIMSVGADKMLLMQNNLNLSSTQIISTYVYQIGIASSSPRYSYGAAISLFNTAINFTLLVITNTICKKLNQSSLW
jgi:ABC-type polysaccharide transport system permease subunit